MEKNELSRRSFLKGAAAGVLSVAGLGALSARAAAAAPASGGDPAADGNVQTKPLWAPEKWDYEADVVICGCGVAGIMGAREATRQGHSCLILEKAARELAGGSSTCFGGYYVPSQPETMEASCAGILTREEADALAAQTVEDYTWMMYNGMSVNSFYKVDGAGAGFYRVLRMALETMGVPVLYETAARDLIRDPYTNEVFGVKAAANGRELAVKANKGVLLATGSVSGSPELLERFFMPKGLELINSSSPANTGDGLMMGLQAGAMLHNMTQHGVELQPFSLKKASQEVGSAVVSYLTGENRGAKIIVDQSGSRFMNEDLELSHYKGLLDWAQFPGAPQVGGYQGFIHKPFYLIFDSQVCGTEGVGAYLSDYSWSVAMGLHRWSADNREELEKGWIAKGDTLEELVENLAAQSGNPPIDAEGLKATIEAYNQACAAGQDAYGRTGAQSLDKGPYYAAELAATVMYTVGGLQTNGAGAALDWTGAPIPGLYSAGDVGQPSGANPIGVCACGAMGALAVRDMVTHANREIPGDVDAVMEKPNETAMAVAAGGLYALSGEGQEGGQAAPGSVTNSILSDAVYNDGTYTGVGSSTIGGDIQVTVTVSGGKVTNVRVDSHNETNTIGGMAFDTFTQQAVAGNTYEIDGVSGATETAKGFAEAVRRALEQAR